MFRDSTSTLSNFPVFQRQVCDAGELPGVVRDQDVAVRQRDRGDLQVVRADRRAGLGEVGANPAEMPGRCAIEGQ